MIQLGNICLLKREEVDANLRPLGEAEEALSGKNYVMFVVCSKCQPEEDKNCRYHGKVFRKLGLFNEDVFDRLGELSNADGGVAVALICNSEDDGQKLLKDLALDKSHYYCAVNFCNHGAAVQTKD